MVVVVMRKEQNIAGRYPGALCYAIECVNQQSPGIPVMMTELTPMFCIDNCGLSGNSFTG